MPVVSESQQSSHFSRGIMREVTPLSLWGGDTLIYKSVIALAAIALPTIAAANWFVRGTLSWPQLAMAGAVLAGALLCHELARLGKSEVAAALLIGVVWIGATIYAFESGYGMHSAVVFMYLPCVLYTALFFGLATASAELAITVAALMLMYLAEESGRLGGAAAFAAHGTNLTFLVGVCITTIGTLIAGAVYHRRVESEAARVVAEAERRRLAMEQTQVAQAQLQTTHAKLQALHAELAARDRSLAQELARARRDLDLLHDVVAKDFAASLRELRDAVAAPDEATEARLHREIGRMEAVVGLVVELGRHSQPQFERTPLNLSVLAEEVVRDLRAGADFTRVRFDIDANLPAAGDRQLVASLLRHLVRRAARACKSEPQPLVHVGSGSREGRAVFYVRDNGPGMDGAQRDKLFRPIERGAAEHDTVDIGIVSARRIAERHGGELTVESAPGSGTTYFFSLPAS